MAASFTLSRPDLFPSGTSVGAYVASGWSQATLPPTGAPPVAATETATASASSAAFVALTADAVYYFGASVSGTWRYVRGRTAPASTSTTESDPVAEADLATHIADHTNPHAVTKTQVSLGNADNTSDANKPVSTAAQAALDAINGVYRPILRASGRALTGGSGTNYMLSSGNNDSSAPASGGSGPQSIALLNLEAADYAISGKTAKFRIKAILLAAAAPGVTVTVGLHPVTAGATTTAGAASAATSAITPATNGSQTGSTSDFSLPADGLYSLGYTLSGTPTTSNAIVIHAVLQLHYV
jgi:hypothetical protein